MPTPPQFRKDLIERYDKPGPPYTSYPPASEFHDKITEADYREWVRQSNEELIPKPLSLSVHIPFCSSICHYCGCHTVIKGSKKKVEPYLHDLYREIELQGRLFDADRTVRQLHWGGGTPGFLTRQQSERLMTELGRHFRFDPSGAGEHSIEIDPRIMQAGDVRHLHGLGFNRISIGVQDFDPRVQQAVNRSQSVEETAAVIDEARDCGIRSINIDLIYGLPHQGVNSFENTLDTVIALDPDRIALYSYSHLPKSNPPQRRIRAEDLPLPAENLAILESAIDRLCAAGYEYIGMDHFARPKDDLAMAQRRGMLVRNFHGYSTLCGCDSIGFGVSAVSQVADNYSQNATDLKSYHSSLARYQLPVVRGYRSDHEDLLRRAVIQDLACRFRLDKRRIASEWGIDFERHFSDELDRLETLQQDGLVEIGDTEIRVLAPGRLLVRGICMIFDQFQQCRNYDVDISRTL